ncbi:MAG: YiiX/YebB-like N1pC/P60 family cysteine hydrolase, partial [Pirellulaceae bacterium]|nr:YiiX/YebB-like N1pC/P60 family cysteine hydrolase [Pirellulaceae bacterium]
PGYWPHAALFLGSANALQQLEGTEQETLKSHLASLQERTSGGGIVMESMRDGVHLRPLSSPFGSDSIVVMRPQLAPSDVTEALTRSLSHHGKPYDFNFDFSRSDRLVCTEVVYRAFDGVGAMDLPLVQRVGRPSLSGDDLIGMAVMGQSFDAVAVYAPTFSNRIASGAEAQSLINQARGTQPPPQ